MTPDEIKTFVRMLGDRSGPAVQMLPGVLESVSDTQGSVVLDGTTRPIGVNVITDCEVGDRVMVLFVPPRGGFVVGRVGVNAVAPLNTAWGFVASGSDALSRANRTQAVDIATGVSVTFTAPAERRYKISGVCGAVQVTSQAAQSFFVYKGGSLLQKLSEQVGFVGTINTLHGFALDTPAAGSVTYSLRLATGAGTVDARGDILTTRIIIEDVGPAA